MKASKLALGAIIGAAVGMATGILTAPKSGKETREGIRNKALETKDKAATARDDLIFKAEEVADDIRVKATDKLNEVTKKHRK